MYTKRGKMNKFITKLFLVFSILFSNFAHGQEFEIHSVDKMPHIPAKVGYYGEAPVEQRGIEFRKWLAPSVKIAVADGSGSGTIVYYDSVKNIAYVATCGHLWNYGTMSAEEGLRRNMTCKIITWYQNDKKLAEPKTYTAQVVFYNHITGADTALVTFQPDWRPNYFPIAAKDYEYKKGSIMHSVGCDGGREVAHYEVEVVGVIGESLTTIKNSPRPGRSGGGLMDDKYYIATCWATSIQKGISEGYFTPLPIIHQVWNRNGYGFLLNIKPTSDLATKIKIVDRTERQKKYEENYILLPN